jgi:hypothetical protein
MIVLSDGDPDPPGAAQMQAIRGAGITVSTICYGAHGGQFVARMQGLAQQGGGKFHYLQSAENLPELFLREAVTVTKSLIHEQPFAPLVAEPSPILRGIDADSLPLLEGHVMTSPKDLASVPIVRRSREEATVDPILATWSYGVGKSAAFTSDTGRLWGRRWAEWEGYRRFWLQCARWVMRVRSSDRYRVAPSVEGENGLVIIDAVTPDGQFVNGLEFEATVMTPEFETVRASARQVAPGRYQVTGPASRKGTYTYSIRYQDSGGVPVNLVAGVSVPYSAEYRRLETNRGLLAEIAEAGGGRLHDDPVTARLFSRDLPPTREVSDVWQAILTAAILVFFADVFVRRVVVNYLRVVAAQCRRAFAVFGVGSPPVAADARLATLLERKAKLREESDKRYRPGERAVPASGGGAPVREAGRDIEAVVPGTASTAEGGEAGGHETRHGRGGLEPSRGGREGSEAKEESADARSYTSRLLEAKRRARERGRGGGR